MLFEHEIPWSYFGKTPYSLNPIICGWKMPRFSYKCRIIGTKTLKCRCHIYDGTWGRREWKYYMRISLLCVSEKEVEVNTKAHENLEFCFWIKYNISKALGRKLWISSFLVFHWPHIANFILIFSKNPIVPQMLSKKLAQAFLLTPSAKW